MAARVALLTRKSGNKVSRVTNAIDGATPDPHSKHRNEKQSFYRGKDPFLASLVELLLCLVWSFDGREPPWPDLLSEVEALYRFALLAKHSPLSASIMGSTVQQRRNPTKVEGPRNQNIGKRSIQQLAI